MAKEKERELAHQLFVKFNKNQKEIAFDLSVTPKTVGVWAEEGNWKAERTALVNNTHNRAEKYKAVLEDFADEQIMLSQKIKEEEASGNLSEASALRKLSVSISSQVGMYQKALEKLDKDSKVLLSTKLEVVEHIFQAMQEYDKKLFLSSLDFQRYYIQSIAK